MNSGVDSVYVYCPSFVHLSQRNQAFNQENPFSMGEIAIVSRLKDVAKTPCGVLWGVDVSNIKPYKKTGKFDHRFMKSHPPLIYYQLSPILIGDLVKYVRTFALGTVKSQNNSEWFHVQRMLIFLFLQPLLCGSETLDQLPSHIYPHKSQYYPNISSSIVRHSSESELIRSLRPQFSEQQIKDHTVSVQCCYGQKLQELGHHAPLPDLLYPSDHCQSAVVKSLFFNQQCKERLLAWLLEQNFTKKISNLDGYFPTQWTGNYHSKAISAWDKKSTTPNIYWTERFASVPDVLASNNSPSSTSSSSITSSDFPVLSTSSSNNNNNNTSNNQLSDFQQQQSSSNILSCLNSVPPVPTIGSLHSKRKQSKDHLTKSTRHKSNKSSKKSVKSTSKSSSKSTVQNKDDDDDDVNMTESESCFDSEDDDV